MQRWRGLSRREFLRCGAAACAIGSMACPANAAADADRRCIFLWLTGGPSQLDTFDPKPDAPIECRGPFRPIATRIPGLHVTELLPRLATQAHRVAFIRSMHHDAAPVHETGQQLLQTGRLCRLGSDDPHIGAVLSAKGLGPWAILPGPLGDTGVDVSHGQTAGGLGPNHEPACHCESVFPGETDRVIERYGRHEFGRNCLSARRLIESGKRLAVVNMFSTVYGAPSWDCHADGGRLRTNLNDYRDIVVPMFDQAIAALIDDLVERGLLDSTLVVAAGEFGRTPRINSRGGRDHWPGVWTVLLAGAGIEGGAVIGSSDSIGSEPDHRPVTPAECVATIYRAMGVDIPNTIAATPIHELFS